VLASIVAGIGVGIVWTNTDALISQLAAAAKWARRWAPPAPSEFSDMIGPILIGLLAQAQG
jgi:hypothetical protein